MLKHKSLDKRITHKINVQIKKKKKLKLKNIKIIK